jgi:hypothetical protein
MGIWARNLSGLILQVQVTRFEMRYKIYLLFDPFDRPRLSVLPVMVN